MSLFVSARRGNRIIGAKTLILVTLAWCLIPATIGGLGWLWLDLTGGGSRAAEGGAGQSGLQMFFYLLFLSPLISGPFWLATGIGTALFCKFGAYGSISALIWGGVLGWGAAQTAVMPMLIIVGALLVTYHRFTLAMLRPAAF